MDAQANQGPGIANFAVAIRSIGMLVLLLPLAIYFLADKLEPLGFPAHKLGETLGALNDLKVLVTYLHGMRTTIGPALRHVSNVWCMFMPGPSCDAPHRPDGPEPGRDLRKAPLANTKEMLDALQYLSEFDTDIDFPKRWLSMSFSSDFRVANQYHP